MLPNNIV